MAEQSRDASDDVVERAFVGFAAFLLVVTGIGHGLLLGIGLEHVWPQLSRMLASPMSEPPLHVWPIITPVVFTAFLGGLAWRSQRAHPHARASAIHSVTIVPWLVTCLLCASLSSFWLTRSRTYAFSRVHGFRASESESLFTEMISGFFRALTFGFETAGRIVEVVLDQIAVLALTFSTGIGVIVVLVWLFLRHRLA